MGNLRSVSKALEHVAGGRPIVVTADPAVVAAADRVVFPGQGAMPDCMRELDARGLRPAVLAAAAHKPFLGICIGLQMLFGHSQEGDVAGLGVFAGDVRRFPGDKMIGRSGQRLKVPHMGWNEVRPRPHPLWADIPESARFYFVHSYCVQPDDATLVTGTADYGLPFTCAVGRDNIFAVQFHPEKSARDGLQLLKNFVDWQP
ncbi:hypothetical protein B566_EDAN003206 [Ephemera danica]|nr:hypothetical protein B566_EDAN003206 [Ephemera danica]